MNLRRILFALALAAFVAPIGSYAAVPKTAATHKPAVKQPKCKPTKTHKCYGGPAPSHM